MAQTAKTNKSIIKVVFYTLLIVIIIGVTFPFIWMILASFKSMVDLLNADKMFIFTPTIQNYIDVFSKYDFLRPIINSLIIGVISTLLSLVLGLPTAYSIAREKQTLFSGIILIIRIIPAITFLVPWYIIFNKIHLTGTYTALILAHLLVSLPLIIWIMIPYYEQMPKELEQAAWVDGCSKIGTFFKIMLPLSTPGILTSAILAFIFSWNNFIFALVLATNDTKTLPMAVFNFISYTEINWPSLMAAAVLITLPILVISMALQRYVIAGLTAGAVKG